MNQAVFLICRINWQLGLEIGNKVFALESYEIAWVKDRYIFSESHSQAEFLKVPSVKAASQEMNLGSTKQVLSQNIDRIATNDSVLIIDDYTHHNTIIFRENHFQSADWGSLCRTPSSDVYVTGNDQYFKFIASNRRQTWNPPLLRWRQ